MKPDDSNAYLIYHDYERQLTFQWDGNEDEGIEAHAGGLMDHRTEMIPLQGRPFSTDDLPGWLRWFESVCKSHIRMRTEAGEEVVRDAPQREATER